VTESESQRLTGRVNHPLVDPFCDDAAFPGEAGPVVQSAEGSRR
jgi:hypothetical protein